MPGDQSENPSDKKAAAAAPWQFWLPLCLVVMVISGVLLFWRLGFYPFWCDEADTAFYARGIARTGDTYAVMDHNIYAFRHGLCLKNLCGRFVPPASLYLAAPFVGVEGTGSFWPRFPFAVCGLLSVALLLYWAVRSGQTRLNWIVFCLGLLGNVSFFLYCRQCRYFALATLLSLVVVYFYLYWDVRWWKLTCMVLASILLLWTHYLAYIGLYAALGCDYLIAQRRVRPLRWTQWLALLGPQLLAGICAVMIYNPVGIEVWPGNAGRNFLRDKLTLFWWNLREINACEFGVGLLMLAAPLLYLLEKNRWLLRALLAILSYTLIIAILSPQPVNVTWYADIRYLEALIPLCIFLTSLSIVTLARHKWAIAIGLALLAFGTNILHLPWSPSLWRSTICQWVEELGTARRTSTQQAIDWIDANVKAGQSIWVYPDDLMYPLMYHAPQARYAWQLQPPPQGQFKDLPPIHFIGRAAPDYILAFGLQPRLTDTLQDLKRKLGANYQLVAMLDVYWNDLTRPELFWRSFRPLVKYNLQVEAVYILKRREWSR